MRKIFTRKRVIWGAIIALVLGGGIYYFARPKNNASQILTDKVTRQDLRATVLATGQVVSSTDLALSFKSSGTVAKINAQVGDDVKNGDILATLDQNDVQASLAQAQGSLAQAQANYQKVLAGASSEDITVTQRAVDTATVTLDNAKKILADTKVQQQTLVDNAYRTYLNSGLAAVPSSSNLNTTNPTISGTYTGTQTGTYTIRQSGNQFYVEGLENGGNGYISTVMPVPLGTFGLYILFPTDYTGYSDSWNVQIPNPSAATYVTNYNAYLSALETQRVAVSTAENTVASAQAALDQQTAQLALKKAQARPADIALAEAQILTAQGQVQSARAALENTIVRAPAAGTITSIDVKVGELATALKEVFVLQDVNNLHLEADISEANVAAIQPGQSVKITFDAFGPDRTFTGTVSALDPASTVVSGVVNYKLTANLEKVPDIRPGMTANMEVLTASKDGVLAIPQRAVISRDGKKYARIITDPEKKTYVQQEITIGLEADQGLVEVTAGLQEGQEIVTFVPA